MFSVCRSIQEKREILLGMVAAIHTLATVVAGRRYPDPVKKQGQKILTIGIFMSKDGLWCWSSQIGGFVFVFIHLTSQSY